MSSRPAWATVLLVLAVLSDVCSQEVGSGADGSFVCELRVQYPQGQIPDGSELFLRGDNGGLSWTTGTKLTQSQTSRDTWTLTVTVSPSSSGIFSMKVLIDDEQWQLGPNTQMSIDASVGAKQVFDIHPWFYTQKGRYTQPVGPFTSTFFQNQRDIILYLPPSYDENPYKTGYNTLIMHDGENLFNASTSFGGVAWMCQDTINRLLNQSAMREIIIVGVYNTLDRMAEYTYSKDPQYGGGEGDHYLDFLEKVIYPYVEQHYRVDMSQESLGILGSSLGGLISCYAGWTRSHVYSTAGCMSSSFWWNSQDFNTTILAMPKPNNPIQFYLDSGNAGPGKDDVTETITVRDHMSDLGYVLGKDLFYYLDQGGEHNEYYWGQRFWFPMENLYPPEVSPAHALTLKEERTMRLLP